MTALDAATAKDVDDTRFVFRVLKLRPHLRRHFLQLYEASCHRGQGSVDHLRQLLRVNQNDHFFFDKTFLYFHDKPNTGRAFTCPQFCVMLHHFLSCDHEALVAWMFCAYFGGDTCDYQRFATQDEVFQVMDVLYGVSKAHDYRPGSEYLEVSMSIGNSHSYDVKRTKLLIKSTAVLPPKDLWPVGIDKNKVAKVVGVVQFAQLVRKSPDLIRRIFAVQHYTRELCGWKQPTIEVKKSHDQLEDDIARIVAEEPDAFGHDTGGRSKRTPFSNREVMETRRESMRRSGGGSGGGGGGGGGGVARKNNKKKAREAQEEAKGEKKKRQAPTHVTKKDSKSDYVVVVQEEREEEGHHEQSSIYHRLESRPDNGRERHRTKKRPSYVAQTDHPGFTGPAHALDHHREAAIILQRRRRGMVARAHVAGLLNTENVVAHLHKANNEMERARERARQRAL